MLESKDNSLLVSHCSQLYKKTKDKARKEQSLTLLEGFQSHAPEPGKNILGLTAAGRQENEDCTTDTAPSSQQTPPGESQHSSGTLRASSYS